MSYEPTEWQDHVTEYPGEYILQKTDRGTYTIVPAGKVLKEGTPQNAENFNKIEAAISELFGLSEDVEQSGALATLTSEQIDALDNLFRIAVYTDDTSKTAYTNFLEAFGLDEYSVFREFSTDELLLCGLSYYYKWNTTAFNTYGAYTRIAAGRTSYVNFDIPMEYGYTYKFEWETAELAEGETAPKIGVEVNNQLFMDAVANSVNATSSDKLEINWYDSPFEYTPPETVNNSPVVSMRFCFDTDTVTINKVIISRKRAV